MSEYKTFLLVVFKVVQKNGWTHLCSQAVLNKVTSLLGGKKAFCEYVKQNPLTFFSVQKSDRTTFGCVRSKSAEIKTSCHSEFLLNELYHNGYTESHALWLDYMYTLIHEFLNDDNFSNPCTIRGDIIEANGGSEAFKLSRMAEQERNECNSSKRQKEKIIVCW